MRQGQEQEGNRGAVAALVCGLAAILFALVPGLFFMPWIPGGVAIWLGSKARQKPARRKMANWACGLGVVSIVLAGIWTISVIQVLSSR